MNVAELRDQLRGIAGHTPVVLQIGGDTFREEAAQLWVEDPSGDGDILVIATDQKESCDPPC